MSLFSSISGFISNAIVGGDNQVHLPSAPAPLADVMSTASAMTSAFFSDSKPQHPPAAAKPPPSSAPAAQPPLSSTPAGSRDRVAAASSSQSRPPSASSLSESVPAAASRTAVPGRPSVPPPPPQPGKVAVEDGPDLGPEFSHLSAEERRQIQVVMARAAQMTDDRQPTGYTLPLRRVYIIDSLPTAKCRCTPHP